MSPKIEQIIGRALVDSKFRAQLENDTAHATKQYALSQNDLRVLDNLDTSELDALAEDLTSNMQRDVLACGNCM